MLGSKIALIVGVWIQAIQTHFYQTCQIVIKILLSGKQILGTVTKIKRIVFQNIEH